MLHMFPLMVESVGPSLGIRGNVDFNFGAFDPSCALGRDGSAYYAALRIYSLGGDSDAGPK
jgi:hypothetical protein